MIAAVIGSGILSIVVVLNSRGATRYHVGFPVYIRASAGVTGAKFFIVVRASVAVIYFATQTFYGGMITGVGLRAIFGSRWENIPNQLPASANITSKNLLSFFIFWIIQFPVMFIHPTILRHVFVVKSVVTTAAMFGVLGWAVKMNGGSLGNLDFGVESLSGAALVWPMISAINSVMSALCPILINQPDIARYATKPSQATWSQGTGILISKVLVMFISCTTTSAAAGFLGKSYWNIWDLYDQILTQYWGPGARAGVFFASAVCLSRPHRPSTSSHANLPGYRIVYGLGSHRDECRFKLPSCWRRCKWALASIHQHRSGAGHLCLVRPFASPVEDHFERQVLFDVPGLLHCLLDACMRCK